MSLMVHLKRKETTQALAETEPYTAEFFLIFYIYIYVFIPSVRDSTLLTC